MHDAVNPVADTKGLGQRLQVNVRGPRLEGFDNQGIDKLDDGGVRIDSGPVVGHILLAGGADFNFTFGDVLDHLANGIVGRAVIFVQGGVDVLIHRHAQLDLGVDHALQGIDDIEIGRVGQGDDDRVIVLGDRHGPVTLGHMPGHGGYHVISQADVAQVDEFVAEMGGFGLGDINGADDFAVKKEVNHAVAVGGGFLPHGRGLRFAQVAHVNQ